VRTPGDAPAEAFAADLTRVLLGEDVEPAQHKLLMTMVLPLAAWGAAVLVVVAAGRYLLVKLPRLRATVPAVSFARRWLRPVLLPALGYLALASPVLAPLPLGLVRHMAPDIGWGVTVTGCLALVWAVLRTSLAVSATRAGKQAATPAEPPARTARSHRSPVRAG
jgi:hypothetical protein